jgi:hypothetical protein
MKSFVKEFKCSLSPELCNDIIMKFELQEDKYIGETQSGVNINVKNTIDYLININEEKENSSYVWTNIERILYQELTDKIIKYTEYLNHRFFGSFTDPDNYPYKFLHKQYLSDSGFLIQKYTKKIGKYIYHNDFKIEPQQDRYRVITFLWYLNDIEEGGTTEFLGGEFEIKPEKGKLILFPACWTFPHTGNVPISHDKYIITGWFSVENITKVININIVKNNEERI